MIEGFRPIGKTTDRVNIGEYQIDLETYNKLCKEAYDAFKEINNNPTPIKIYCFQMGYVMRYLKTLNSIPES